MSTLNSPLSDFFSSSVQAQIIDQYLASLPYHMLHLQRDNDQLNLELTQLKQQFDQRYQQLHEQYQIILQQLKTS